MSEHPYFDYETGSSVASAKLKLRKPPMYKVVLMNDDYTPMNFVVELLVRFFLMDEIRAMGIMLEIHHQGRGVCGVYTKDVAETKVAQVNAHARQNTYPLLCTMEAE